MKVIKHPVVGHQLTILRDKQTNSQLFRSCLKCLSYFLAFDVTKDLEEMPFEVETPICKTVGSKIKDKIIILPILRAGLGMVDSFREMLPTARIGHIGLYRDEATKKPKQYYAKFPETINGGIAIVLDPMLATGQSAIEAINLVKQKHPKKIKFVSIISCPEGIKAIEQAHPDVETYTAVIDQKLNDNGFIVPGLGDAGDRIFGTK